ncbi:MAG: ATP-binding protein [Oligoflexus sp.]
MLSIENYYEIKKYSDDQWQLIRHFQTQREQLKNDAFLSANHSCLIGEKGVGKTILACQKAMSMKANDTSEILYASLDDTLFSSYSMFDIARMAQEHDIKLVVFDEVHRYVNWKTDLKSICDRLKIRTIVSGSSILSFDDLGGLARRIVKYELKGMSFREYLNLSYQTQIERIELPYLLNNSPTIGAEIKQQLEAKIERNLGSLFEEYLKKGYYAYSLTEPNLENFLQMLRQATEDTIAYEIILSQSHSRPDMSRKLQMLFKAIAQNVPYTVHYQSLQKYAGITDLRTLKHYLACLEKAGIISRLDKKTLKSLRKADKLYLGNTSLYFAYANLNPNIGSLRETFFLNSLRLAKFEVLAHDGRADFAVDDYVFEVGGPNKSWQQLKEQDNAFLIKDINDISANPKIIPLWLFGFLA